MAEVVLFLLAAAVVIGVVVGYAYGSRYLLLNGVLPVLLAAAVLGAVSGVVLGAVAVVSALWARPADVSPEDHRDACTPSGGQDPAPDTAWPLYGSAQMTADIARCWSRGWALGSRPWRSARRAFFSNDLGAWWGWWLFWPIPVTCLVFLGAMSLGTAAVNVVTTVTILLVSGAVTLVQALVVAVLRVAEWTWQRTVRAEASCPSCYYVSRRPAFRCATCESLHRDVRPGRLGVLARRCDCGTLLPTTVVRASRRLTAVCQRCQIPLGGGAAAVRDVRIPIFGGVSAGKTRFLYAALDALTTVAQRHGLPLSHPSQESQRAAEVALNVIRAGADTAKTSPGSLPTALTCSIGKGPSRALVHLFDAAGEHYGDGGAHDSLGFLQTSRQLIFVLDPFAVRAVRDRATGATPALLDEVPVASGDVEDLYSGVVRRIRDSGVRARSQQLAVVVSKADLLARAGIELPEGSDEIADWVADMGLHNVVLSARQDFADVRFFAVHSTSSAAATPGRSAEDVVRWLLAGAGVQLPAPATVEVSPA